jgi:uroporphyrinogen III methyltransferase / synthase
MAAGKVYLVGAGPGDPGLITLRAVEVLQQADAVLYDYLVNPAILRHCRPTARLISLGKHGAGRILSQAEIHDRLLELGQSGQSVVRLKCGDPMVFARAGEELAFLTEHQIPFEIVPGVTAGLAAASYAGIPVTHRDAASAVALITGQEDADKSDTSLDYAALAAFPGTLVLYMGVTTVSRWSESLIAAGKPPSTPVLIARRVSLPDQERLLTTLGEVASVVGKGKLRPPVVFIVGEAAALGRNMSWFEQRPLFGQTVLVTRPRAQADALATPLAQLGAQVLLQPAIEIKPAADQASLINALEALARFDWVVFSSANGVTYFLDTLLRRGQDLRSLGRAKIAAIGPGTAEELARYHLRADVVPDEYRAESLAGSLAALAPGRRFLLVRASRGRDVLARELASAGGHVEEVVAYDSVDIDQPDPAIAERMASGSIDWTTVTSSAIALGLVRMFGESLRRTRLVSISPITSATLRQAGFEPEREATVYTMAGVVAALGGHSR